MEGGEEWGEEGGKEVEGGKGWGVRVGVEGRRVWESEEVGGKREGWGRDK